MKEEAKEKATELFIMVLSMMPKCMTQSEAKTAAKSMSLTVATEIRFDCSCLTRVFWDTVIKELNEAH